MVVPASIGDFMGIGAIVASVGEPTDYHQFQNTKRGTRPRFERGHQHIRIQNGLCQGGDGNTKVSDCKGHLGQEEVVKLRL